MKPWLVFFDIDGTLLFPGGISPQNTAAIDRLRADGTFITIRLSNQESLDSVLKALDLIVPVSVHRQGPSVRLSAK